MKWNAVSAISDVKATLLTIGSLVVLAAVAVGAPDADPAVSGCKGLLDQKKYSEAVAACTAVLEKEPRQRDAYRLRAIANRSLKQYDASVGDYTRALELDPQAFDLFAGRALTKREMKNLSSAVEDMARAVELAPQNETARLNNFLGNLKYDAGDYQGALEPCLKARQTARTPENQFCVGRILLKLGQYENAVMEFDAIIAANAMLPNAYRNRAKAHLELGNAEKARKDFDKALELRPDLKSNPDVQDDLAKLEQVSGKKPAAPSVPVQSPSTPALSTPGAPSSAQKTAPVTAPAPVAVQAPSSAVAAPVAAPKATTQGDAAPSSVPAPAVSTLPK